MHRPTDEQAVALEYFRKGQPLKISAFAGAGKTTTLELLARSRTSRGAYLAFNKSIATDASGRFPRSVDCRTTHSIAWRAVQSAHRFSTGKMKDSLFPKQLAEVLSIKDRIFGPKFRLTGVHQAHLLLRTIRNFCQSADPEIVSAHVPRYGRLLGASEAILVDVLAWAQSEATILWKRMLNHRDATPLGHDGYLKVWALGRPNLGYQYILLDEAQDTNPVVLGVLADQTAQIVYVGDKHQQIYEWRGAINAMEQIEGCDEAYLTRSFRFGTTIAEVASQVLQTLGETRPVRGSPTVISSINASGRARTVLARTNATVILEVLEAINADLRPCVVGGTDDLKRLLSDVFELKKNTPGICPEFFGFESWEEVVAFSETEEGEDVRTFVQLVEQHGERKLWAAVSSAQGQEEESDVILSTAHKAKGREWDSVRLAPDFLSSRLNGVDPGAEAEVRLFYVAMTRAKRHLIAEPEMLGVFTSGGWKAQKQESVRSPPGGPFVAPPTKPPPLPTTDISVRSKGVDHQINGANRARRPNSHGTEELARASQANSRTQGPEDRVQRKARRWWQLWG